MKPALFFSVMSALVLTSCSSPNDDPRQMPVSEGTVHPREEYIPFEDDLADRVDITSGLQAEDDGLKNISRRLRLRPSRRVLPGRWV